MFKNLLIKRWATNLGSGSTSNNRGSAGRRLGVKIGHGDVAQVCQIIIRQRGLQYHPGLYVGVGNDHTLYALKNGKVRFSRDYDRRKVIVNIDPFPGQVPKGYSLHEQRWLD